MNKELAISKGLIEKDNDSIYRLIEKIYKYLFELFLIDKIDLRRYDYEINNNDCFIGKASIEESDKNTPEFLNLNSMLLLNNFFVEKLEKEDINKIREYIKEGKFQKDNELINIVERTYKEVIKNNYLNGKYTDTPYKISYGAAVPGNFAANDALVFKIIYGKNTKQMEGNEFVDNRRKQEELIKGVAEKLKKEIKEKLDINAEVIIDKVYR